MRDKRPDIWKDRLPSNLKDLEERKRLLTKINIEYFELLNEEVKSRIRLNNSMAALNERRTEFNKKFDEEFLEESIEEFREFLKQKKERRHKNPLTT